MNGLRHHTRLPGIVRELLSYKCYNGAYLTMRTYILVFSAFDVILDVINLIFASKVEDEDIIIMYIEGCVGLFLCSFALL